MLKEFDEDSDFERSIEGQLSIPLDHRFVQGVIDLYRLRMAVKKSRKAAVKFIDQLDFDRVPYVWGWFHRGGLPLSHPDRWFESLRYDRSEESELDEGEEEDRPDLQKTYRYDMDSVHSQEMQDLLGTYRHDLVTFVDCDNRDTVTKMLDRLIEVGVSVLKQLRESKDFCEAYHNALDLRIGCDTKGSPLGEPPNIWSEIGGLSSPPDYAPEVSSHTIADVTRFTEVFFSHAFDALAFLELEDEDFWYESLVFPELSEQGDNALETRFNFWFEVSEAAKYWFVGILIEARDMAIKTHQIPSGWEDTLTDAPFEKSDFGDVYPALHASNVFDWSEFVSSGRPFFTLPLNPLSNFDAFRRWLSISRATLAYGIGVETTTPHLFRPPSKELATELTGYTLRNAFRWLIDQDISGFPGEHAEIPDGPMQRELLLERLFNWSSKKATCAESEIDEAEPSTEHVLRVTNESDDSNCESDVSIPVATELTPTNSEQTDNESTANQGFRHSEDFSSVWWNGKRFDFTTSQAICVEILWNAHQNKTPLLSGEYIAEKAGIAQHEIRRVFVKKIGNKRTTHPAYGTLVISPQKGKYALDIDATWKNT